MAVTPITPEDSTAPIMWNELMSSTMPKPSMGPKISHSQYPSVTNISDVFLLDHSPSVRMKRVVAMNHHLTSEVRRLVPNHRRSGFLSLVNVGVVPITDLEVFDGRILAVRFWNINELEQIDVLVIGMLVHAPECPFDGGTHVARVHVVVVGR
jgi:hypothetical protein